MAAAGRTHRGTDRTRAPAAGVRGGALAVHLAVLCLVSGACCLVGWGGIPSLRGPAAGPRLPLAARPPRRCHIAVHLTVLCLVSGAWSGGRTIPHALRRRRARGRCRGPWGAGPRMPLMAGSWWLLALARGYSPCPGAPLEALVVPRDFRSPRGLFPRSCVVLRPFPRSPGPGSRVLLLFASSTAAAGALPCFERDSSTSINVAQRRHPTMPH